MLVFDRGSKLILKSYQIVVILYKFTYVMNDLKTSHTKKEWTEGQVRSC
jgi:hypothetical protein